MAFNAGELVATIRLEGADRIARDLAGTRSQLDQVDQKTTRARGAFGDFGAAIRQASDAAREHISQSEAARKAVEGLGTAGVAAGSLLAAGIAVAVARFADFDAQMSNVSAATHETASNMEQLRGAAIDAGSSTVFSATEAAGAIEELAKAGVSTADILSGGLAGSLDLAAAGELGVARAAEITSTALNQFGLAGSEASHVSDVLAAGAGKAMGSVDDLANGLKFVGPVAASMGVSLEETTGVLALFAQQGIIGEQAGTSLRGVLASLTSPSAEARAEIERLGLSLYDSQGNFIGLQAAAGQLAGAYRSMDGASRDASLGVIFGRETVTAATALYQAGADGVDEWTRAVDDSGYAAETARMRLDNLKGDLEALGGALDAALIETGSAANDTLREMVQALTGLVDMYGDLPEPVQRAVLMIGGGTAAVTLAGGAALLAVPKFLEMRTAITTAGLSMGRIALQAGAAGLALGGLFAIVGELAAQHAEAQASARAYADTLADGTGKVTDATRKMTVEALAADEVILGIFNHGSAFDAAEKLGVSFDLITDAAMGSTSAFQELDAQIKAGSDGSLDYANAATVIMNAVNSESAELERGIEVFGQKEEATRKAAAADDGAAESSQSAAAAYMDAANGADQLRSELDHLIDTVNEANGVGQDAISANIAYRDAVASLDEQIAKARDGQEGYALTLDLGTDAGRANTDMLNDLASRSQAAAEAQFQLDGNTDAYRTTLEAGRQALVDRATQLGMNADEASALADQIYRIPSSTEWEAIAKTAVATSEIARFIADQERKVIRIGIATFYKDGPQGQPRISVPGAPDRYAAGGPVLGPGTATSDSILARLSNDEHVWTAAEVRAFGGHAKLSAYRADVRSGAFSLPAFATGGPVQIGLRSEMLPATAPIAIRAMPTVSAVSDRSDGNGAGGRPRTVIHQEFHGPFYSYDPHDVIREAEEQKWKALAVAGLTEG